MKIYECNRYTGKSYVRNVIFEFLVLIENLKAVKILVEKRRANIDVGLGTSATALVPYNPM